MTENASCHGKGNLQIKIQKGCKTPVNSRMKATCPLLSPSTGTGLSSSGKLFGKADLEHGSPFGGSHSDAHLVTPLLAGNARGCDVGPALVKLAIATVASPWGKKKHMGSRHLRPCPAAGSHKSKLHKSTWQLATDLKHVKWPDNCRQGTA